MPPCATGTDTSPSCSADPPTPDWQTATFPEATAGGEGATDTVSECFGTAYDAVLAQQQALDASGSPVTDRPVSVQAVSQDGSSATEVGTGSTDDNGDVTAPVDDTPLEGDMSYESSDALTVNLSVQPSGSGSGSRGSGEGLYSQQPDGTIQPGVGDTEPLTTGGLTCDQSQDTTAYTASEASACGDTVYPVAGPAGGPGGEVDYIYYEDGQETGESFPPAGFNPLAATTKQLELYGYPDPPPQADHADYAAWESEVSTADTGQPPPFDAEPAVDTADARRLPPPKLLCLYYYKGSKTSMCWTGDIVTAKSGTPDFINADMSWKEPTWTADSHCESKGPSDGATWVGIGPYRLNYGDKTESDKERDREALAQDGTTWDYPVVRHKYDGKDRFFTETLSEQDPELPNFHLNLLQPISPGTRVEARTLILSNPSRWKFTLSWQDSKLHVRSFYAKPNSELLIDRTEAEYVLERGPPPSLRGHYRYQPLGEFGSWDPTSISADGHTKGASDGSFGNSFYESVNHTGPLPDLGKVQAPWPQTQNYWNAGTKYYLSTESSTSASFSVQFRHCL